MNSQEASYPKPVIHTPPENDPYDRPPGEPPKAPLEAAGAAVEELAWENRGIKRSLFPMPFPDPNNERLQRFREKYDFLNAIKGVEGEFERLMLLRNWLHRKIPNQMKAELFFKRPYPNEGLNPFGILDTATTGCAWWCPHFSQTLRTIYAACGRLSRHVGNVSIYDEELGARTHGVTDVFVQEFGKWVMMDAHYDVHYEKDGIPLSPWEVGEEWHRNKGADVDICVGPERRKVDKALSVFGGKHETCRAFWNQHRWSTDPFTNNGSWFGTTDAQFRLTLVGERHEGVVCYRGRAPDSEIDSGYFTGRIQYTTREADVYPDVGTTRIELLKSEVKGTVRVSIGTFTPNLASIEAKVDDRPWGDVELGFLWYPHEGRNTLTVRTRDRFGNLGRPSSVTAVLSKKPE